MSSKDLIAATEQEVKALTERLRSTKAALNLLYSQRRKDGAPDARFAGWETKDAIRTFLEERGSPATLEEITDYLVAHGATIGNKRNVHNIRISANLNAKSGKWLVCVDEKYALTEWK